MVPSSFHYAACSIAAVSVLIVPAQSARTHLSRFRRRAEGRLLVFGQEVLLVGCACRGNFCVEGLGHRLRQPSHNLLPGQLRPGEARWAPEEHDCPTPSEDEEGAEGNVTRETDNFLNAGTGATARVVFVKYTGGRFETKLNGNPMREGHIVAVLAASVLHERQEAGITEDSEKLLGITTIGLPHRVTPVLEKSDGEADGNQNIKDGEIVQLSNPLVSNYDCVAFSSEDNEDRCFKYGRLKDVFHFRAIAKGPAPFPYVKPARGSLEKIADKVRLTSRRKCDEAVIGATKRTGLHWFSYKCKCPQGQAISKDAGCTILVHSQTENGEGRKFNADNFYGQGCKCIPDAVPDLGLFKL